MTTPFLEKVSVWTTYLDIIGLEISEPYLYICSDDELCTLLMSSIHLDMKALHKTCIRVPNIIMKYMYKTGHLIICFMSQGPFISLQLLLMYPQTVVCRVLREIMQMATILAMTMATENV